MISLHQSITRNLIVLFSKVSVKDNYINEYLYYLRSLKVSARLISYLPSILSIDSPVLNIDIYYHIIILIFLCLR